MKRILLLAFAASIVFGTQARAQVIIPEFPKGPVGPKEILEFQRQLEKAMQLQNQQIEQMLQQRGAFPQRGAFQQRGGGRGEIPDGSISWGGVRLNKADADLQQKFGLDETEGLVVAAVEPNSAADKAGLKSNDVLVKINDKSVPNDLDGFTKLVKDQKVDASADLVVVRNGKEETLKAAKMPELVQANTTPRRPGGGGGGGGRGFGMNPRFGRGIPFPQVQIDRHMIVNGAEILRKQDGDQFSAAYSKGDLKITMSGKMENGRPTPSEITVTEGKQTQKYTNLRDVPAQHREILQQLLPGTGIERLMLFPALPELRSFPGLPMIPE